MMNERHVLIEAWVGEEAGLEVRYGNGRLSVFDQDGSCLSAFALREEVHPGVSVADLVKEHDLRDWLDIHIVGGPEHRHKLEQFISLRTRRLDAREAANEPKLEKGWVKISISKDGDEPSGCVTVRLVAERGGAGELICPDTIRAGAGAWINPDDIRTEEP